MQVAAQIVAQLAIQVAVQVAIRIFAQVLVQVAALRIVQRQHLVLNQVLFILFLGPPQGDLPGHHALSFGDQIAVLAFAGAVRTVPLVAFFQVLKAVISAAGTQRFALFVGGLHGERF